MAYTFLDNADKAKYGSLLTGLSTQTSLKNNQYPKTITEAAKVLCNHRWENAGKINSNNNNKHKDNDKGEDKNDETLRKCHLQC
jgi:hypothetical protein